MAKGTKCHYPANTPKGTGPRIQHSDDTSIERWKTAPSPVVDPPSVENHHEASDNGDIIPDSALVGSDLEFANLGGEYLDWYNPNIDFADFLIPQTNEDTARYPSSGSSSLVHNSTPWTNQTVQEQRGISFPNVTIPTRPNYTVRSLIQRPKLKIGAQRIANLIHNTLKSYPRMMLRHNTLPPFIHPRLIYSDTENDHIEPLNNCISLMHMISSGVQGSRKLFWKNVRLECERFCEEVR